MGTFILDAARDVANSPSGWASLCIADGLNPHGKRAWGMDQFERKFSVAGVSYFIPKYCG